MVARGETPRWNKEAKKWVSAETADSTGEVNIGNSPSDPQENEDTDPDLPF